MLMMINMLFAFFEKITHSYVFFVEKFIDVC
jgi:hypothetical protein